MIHIRDFICSTRELLNRLDQKIMQFGEKQNCKMQWVIGHSQWQQRNPELGVCKDIRTRYIRQQYRHWRNRLGKLFPAGMRPGNVSSCLELDIDADTPASKLTAVRKWLNHNLRQVTNSDLRSITEQMTKQVIDWELKK